MSEIWNLSALCRCCHADGSFKSLELPYESENATEVYSIMLRDAIGVSVIKPPDDLSYSICEDCIVKVRDAFNFKLQVIRCEQKFHEYLQNEAFNQSREIKIESDDVRYDMEIDQDQQVKIEVENDSDNDAACEPPATTHIEDDVKNEETIKEESVLKVDIDEQSVSKPKVKKPATPRTKKVKQNQKSPALRKKEQKSPALRKKEQKSPALRIKQNTTNKLRNCAHCGLRFTKLWDLRDHVQVAHREPFICVDCPQKFYRTTDIVEHVKTHGKTRVKCRYCPKDLAFKTIYMHEIRHIRNNEYSNTSEQVFICDICNKKFTHKASWRNHWESHAPKRFFCDWCGRGFSNHSNMKNHTETVHSNNVYICDICNKEFKLKDSLRKHLERHAGTLKKVFCDTCGHGFNDRTNMMKHVETVHLKLRNYPCSKCDMTFTANKHLKVHLAIKHGENYKIPIPKDRRTTYPIIYQCKCCPETFDNRGTFRLHAMKHNKDGSSPHICHICGRNFTCRYSLKRHIESHNGIKPFACDICEKCFTAKTVLLRHKERVHNKVKKEKTKCSICKLDVEDMEKHHKTHDERPFECQQCHRSYPTTSSLNRHVRVYHKGLCKHLCPICNTKCKTASSLVKHFEKKHVPVGV